MAGPARPGLAQPASSLGVERVHPSSPQLGRVRTSSPLGVGTYWETDLVCMGVGKGGDGTAPMLDITVKCDLCRN